MNIPHPYEDGVAEQWIAVHHEQYQAGTNAVFAIELQESKELVGAIGLTIDRELQKAELGYWIGKPFWNRGYATEAAHLVVGYGFKELHLNRISAGHLVRNPASGKVMRKIGMVHEGTARQDTIKWGEHEDISWYGLLKNEWNPTKESQD